ncbi:DoxX family protein [Nocardia iowensis]|uniref:DoxX family protein n=1 Tax=Nocardia iowensis TaxID=204891 RepID=A0ABX8RT91_NOCIO|nr:DoxX family protein [Nocardia iowensis]QXN92858.1 DoxX family protein [Nocardia iowensis]
MTTKSVLERATTNTELDGVAADIGLLIIRVVFGGLLAVHGAQKLFGWFSGPGLDANAAGFDSMGYNPGKFFGTLAGLCEFGGGLLLALGLLTPLASAIVLGTMINAVNALWSLGLFGKDSYEMPLLFAAVGAAIAFTGPGKFSLDHGRPWQRHGFVWGAGAVVIAIVAAVLTLILKWTL